MTPPLAVIPWSEAERNDGRPRLHAACVRASRDRLVGSRAHSEVHAQTGARSTREYKHSDGLAANRDYVSIDRPVAGASLLSEDRHWEVPVLRAVAFTVGDEVEQVEERGAGNAE